MDPITTIASSAFSGILVVAWVATVVVKLRNGRLDSQPLTPVKE